MNVRLLTATATLSITLAACGSGGAIEQQAATPAAATNQTSQVDVLKGESVLGDLLIGPNGLSLYGFTNDVDAASTCYGTCAEAWPPVIVSDDWTAGPGLDFGIFATTVRDDGLTQLVAGRWPLYYFAGDATAGDVKGQGSGDVWFTVDPNGRLIQDGLDEAAAVSPNAATIGETGLGAALIDSAGFTLYGFLNDVDGRPSCNDSCAEAWPPLLVDGPDLPSDLDPRVFSVAGRDDGSFQLVAGVWPLYRFAGDAGPGDVNGQGSGDVWFVTAPDGSLLGAPSSSSGY